MGNMMEQHASNPEHGSEPEHGTDIALSSIIMIGAAGTAILAVVIILVRGLFVNMLQEERFQKATAQPPAALLQLREQAQTRLNSYGWIDQAQGIVNIPISQAMALASAELSADQRKPAVLATPVVEDTRVETGAAVEASLPDPAQLTGAPEQAATAPPSAATNNPASGNTH